MGQITSRESGRCPRGGNDGLMESEENIKPFPLFPQSLEIATEQRFPHYAPQFDDYELSEGHILTFLSGAHRDISNGRQQIGDACE